MVQYDGFVSDFFTVFTETETDTLTLTPRQDVIESKWLVKNAKVFRGEKELKVSMTDDGCLYLGITKDATCTTVRDCRVTFDYGR